MPFGPTPGEIGPSYEAPGWSPGDPVTNPGPGDFGPHPGEIGPSWESEAPSYPQHRTPSPSPPTPSGAVGGSTPPSNPGGAPGGAHGVHTPPPVHTPSSCGPDCKAMPDTSPSQPIGPSGPGPDATAIGSWTDTTPPFGRTTIAGGSLYQGAPVTGISGLPGGGIMMLAAGAALPIAFKLMGMAFKLNRGRMVGGAAGFSFGKMIRGSIEVAGAGALATIILTRMGISDPELSDHIERLVDDLDDAISSGQIMVPEPRRGESQDELMNQLNYLHINLDNGRMWLTDDYISRKALNATRRRATGRERAKSYRKKR